jgi:hypothetical protein
LNLAAAFDAAARALHSMGAPKGRDCICESDEECTECFAADRDAAEVAIRAALPHLGTEMLF